MGVIRVNVAAMKVGYTMGHPDWANLGQGQPEVGPIRGAPDRHAGLTIEIEDHAYGAVEGLDELREAVAAHYNRLYRKGKASQYTAANVAIAPGGRAALTRIGATMSDTRLGYFTPDYTAYEDLLTTFPKIDPVCIELRPEDGFKITPADLEARVERDRIGSLLISNPCNPTGVAIAGQELAQWVEMGRRHGCAMLMDEFYSHFNYLPGATGPISAAAYVKDVNTDPVVIIDGLTKSFRYPGWRVGWVVAPEDVILSLTAAGSFLDGGPCRPIQRAAIDVLAPSRADQETDAVRDVFDEKRHLMIERLTAMGVTFPADPVSTFYCFGCIANLPAPLNTGEGFMHAAFAHKVLTVPGSYFDVNPHRVRTGASPLEQFVRFSFGPPLDVMRGGLDRLGEMVRKAR
jgi:aspartate/methionine/tyrosine aminotransferase